MIKIKQKDIEGIRTFKVFLVGKKDRSSIIKEALKCEDVKHEIGEHYEMIYDIEDDGTYGVIKARVNPTIGRKYLVFAAVLKLKQRKRNEKNRPRNLEFGKCKRTNRRVSD